MSPSPSSLGPAVPEANPPAAATDAAAETVPTTSGPSTATIPAVTEEACTLEKELSLEEKAAYFDRMAKQVCDFISVSWLLYVVQ